MPRSALGRVQVAQTVAATDVVGNKGRGYVIGIRRALSSITHAHRNGSMPSASQSVLHSSPEVEAGPSRASRARHELAADDLAVVSARERLAAQTAGTVAP